MWVISQRRLREFWQIHPRAQLPLREWYDVVSVADWDTFAKIRATYSSADLVGNCTVFNAAGNHFRVITRVLFKSHKLFILKVMTHAEYDREDWPKTCGCYLPPPKRKAKAT